MLLLKTLIKYPLQRRYLIYRIRDLLLVNFKSFKYKYEKNLKFDYEVENILKKISHKFKLSFRLSDFCRKIIEADPNLITKKGDELVKVINENIEYKSKKNFPELEKNILEVFDKGYTSLDQLKISSKDRDSIIKNSKKIKGYNMHCNYLSYEEKQCWEELKKYSHFASYDFIDMVKIEALNRIIFDPRLPYLAYKTLNCIPTFYGLNLRWSFYRGDNLHGPQQFHRDIENLKCVNFIYNFTETNEGDGSHIYIEKSHNLKSLNEIFDQNKNLTIKNKYKIKHKMRPKDFFKLPFSGYGLNPLIKHYFRENIKYILKDNTPILENNYGIHAADVPINDRCVLLIHFCLNGSLASAVGSKEIKKVQYEKVQNYLEDNLCNRYIYRYLVDFPKK